MPAITRSVVALALFAQLLASGEGTVEGKDDNRHFISSRYGFSMVVPPGWGVSVGLDTPVYFYSRAPSAKFVQGRVPIDGAVIATEAHDTVSGLSGSATTPIAWAFADARALDVSNPVLKPFGMPKESGASQAVAYSYDEPVFSPDEKAQRGVAVFWVFNRQLFAARLTYSAEGHNGPALTKVFLQTVRSVRPLPKTGNR